MRQCLHEIHRRTRGPGLFELTAELRSLVWEAGLAAGLMTVYLPHSSASLLIQENADPDVRADIETFFSELAPHAPGRYRHDTEGPDDMPAHLRAALTQSSLGIPIVDGRPALGRWQGVYLFEHREAPQTRTILVHLIGA
ncbi:MAG: YjbQ family protein [Alphaproteobacteria bacterium]|nr:YjbQ family protein [Alphaproteobacteria bacterium]